MKYIGTKIVDAEPMVLGKFIETYERNPYKNDPVEHFFDEQGYVVKYEDGYTSWCPKKAFEKAYRACETQKDIARKDLQDALAKQQELRALRGSGEYKAMSGHGQVLVDKQISVLDDLVAILKGRVSE